MKVEHTPSSAESHSLVAQALALLKANLLLLAVVSLVIRCLYKRYASPLRNVPGPWLASCSRLWKVWSTYNGHTELDHIALHKKYGPVVRTAPNEVSFGTCNAAKDIFAVGKGFHKTMFYSVFPPKHAPDIFTEVREWKHAQMKRYAVTPYSLAQMQKRSEPIEGMIQLLMEHLEKYATENKRVCNLGNLLHYFAFDVLGEVAFSRQFGFLEQEVDVEGSIKNIDDVQWYDGIVGHIAEYDILLRNNPIRPYLGLQMKPTTMTKIAVAELEKRKQKDGTYDSTGIDLLAELLRAHEANPEKFSVNDVFSIAHGAVFAGSDSTASTMQSFFYLVLNAPKVYANLCQEIDEAQKAGKLSAIVTYAEAQALPYFQACLKEAMRVRPAVGLGIYRKTPPEGVEIDGKFYPGGIEVAVNGWVLHRDASIFGDDCEEFRPERWFERDAKLMGSHLYQFGGGSHLCIGRNLALFEMNKTLIQILREYDVTLVYPGRPLAYHSTFFVVQEGLEDPMRQFYVSDHVALKQDYSLYGNILLTHSDSDVPLETSEKTMIAHVEVPPEILREFLLTNKPPRGYVFVEFANPAWGDSLVSEDDIVLVSRAFRFGEVVKQEGCTMTGTVFGLSENYILEPVYPSGSSAAPACSTTCPSNLPEFFGHPNPHILLHDVPAQEIKRSQDVVADDRIILLNLVGVVEEVEYNTVVMLADSSIMLISNSWGLHMPWPEHQKRLVTQHMPPELEGFLRPEVVAAHEGWSDDGPVARPQRGDFVHVDRSALNTARWLSGERQTSGHCEGIVLDSRAREIMVDWISTPAQRQDTSPAARATRTVMNIYSDVYSDTQCSCCVLETCLKKDVIIYDPGRMPEPRSVGDEAGPAEIHGSTNIHPGQILGVGVRVKFRDPSAAAEKYQGIAGTSHGKFLLSTKYASHDWDLNELKIVYMKQTAAVLWQDGSVTTVDSTLLTIFSLFETDILPTDIVLKREGTRQRPAAENGKVGGAVKVFDEATFFERPHDLLPAAVGVVQSVDPTEKVARVRWFKDPQLELQFPDQSLAPDSRFGPMGDEFEDVSLFEIMCFPSLLRQRGDICVVRAPGSFEVSHNELGESHQSRLARISSIIGTSPYAGMIPSQHSPVSPSAPAPTSKGKEKQHTQADWVGQIIWLGFDGSVIVRLGAAQPCRDVLMDADGIIAVISPRLPLSFDENSNDDDEHSILGLGSESSSLRCLMTPLPISETVEYEGGKRLDNDSGDENWTSEEDEASAGAEEEEEIPEKGTDVDMTDAEEQVDHAAEPPRSLFQLENLLGSEPPAQFLVLEQPPPPDQFNLHTAPSTQGMARIVKEHRILLNSLPEGEIYVRTYESRLDLLRCLIIGPRDTPYEHAPFLIDLYLPREFPEEPPKAHFHSWTSGLGRINPNLYEEGRICLSLLGTWSGRQASEKWSKDATLLQVLVSLQGLVFVRRPFYNEAGFEGYEQSNAYATESDSYSEKAFVMARGFVKSALLRPPGGVEDILAWLYLPRDVSHPTQSLLGTVVERGKALLQRSEEARSNQDDSLVDSAGAKADDTKVFLRPLSRGASIMLRRLIDELQTQLDQFLAGKGKTKGDD
ncbi:hypothetical protein AYL99_06733 [Fonsecaea erecta]|uniref:UBC core domain-containing protein n=1 Tax=Fonsecaea erecta TaxID=1367422 RepID=A0A178ZK73_9EURO|nr:hypothetical protein AYL99_06733 [Fonsecaea erecta]OAP59435.1 hypothetical protein AYL99_06733 [Fonsecaea erecta]